MFDLERKWEHELKVAFARYLRMLKKGQDHG